MSEEAQAPPELRPHWTCTACECTFRRPEVGPIPMPRGWEAADDDGPTCLACVRRGDPKRQKFADAAGARRAQVAQDHKELNALVREILLARADVKGADVLDEVAIEAGTTRGRVRAVRLEMGRRGEVDVGGGLKSADQIEGAAAEKAAARERRRAAKRPAVEAALRKDHMRSDSEIGRVAGASKALAQATRAELGLPKFDRLAIRRKETEESLRRLGETDMVRFGIEVGVTPETARQRLDRLVAEGRATKRPDPGGGHSRRARRLYRAAAATGAPA